MLLYEQISTFCWSLITLSTRSRKMNHTRSATHTQCLEQQWNSVLQYFFIIFISLVLVSFILFWNTFTSNVFFGCDPHFDCFPLHTNNKTPIDTTPLKNCSEFAENENVTILCFQLVYRYSEGIGEAGGFLFIMQVIANLLIYITVRIRTTFSDMYLQTRKMNPKNTPVCSANLYGCVHWP